jgi:hypothetical protein
MNNPFKNPNCDNDKCACANGEIRVLRLSKDPLGSNLLICRACFEHELRWRRVRNTELSPEAAFPLPAWEDLKVYNPGE